MRLSTGHQYRDMGPFRAIRWSSLQSLQMQDPTWGWNVEMQMKAIQKGLRVREVQRRIAVGTQGIQDQWEPKRSHTRGCEDTLVCGILSQRLSSKPSPDILFASFKGDTSCHLFQTNYPRIWNASISWVLPAQRWHHWPVCSKDSGYAVTGSDKQFTRRCPHTSNVSNPCHGRI